ncbi:hypothetical protein SGRIM128S_06290 [Streptomyces griseomycini]
MRGEPSCPKCGGRVRAPGLFSDAWQCAVHGAVHPVQPVIPPSVEALEVVVHRTKVPVWMPWPLPVGWLFTGVACAGDDRSGGRCDRRRVHRARAARRHGRAHPGGRVDDPGGLLLLLIALDLLTGKTDEPQQTKDVNVALVPLGMPLLAGPGAIVSVILAVQKADGVAGQVSVWSAILAIHVVLWLAMRYSLLIIRVIKDGGVVLVTRLAGMMLSAIAVQQIINGVTQVIKGG